MGVGSQLYCGRELSGSDYSAEALFGDDAQMCYNSTGCPYIVAEGHGPSPGEVWCRAARYSNTAAHLCRDDRSKFCHVISMRVGPLTGTYLRVDDGAADVNASAMNPASAAFFGGGSSPAFDTDSIAAFRAFNSEVDDACLAAVHDELMYQHLALPATDSPAFIGNSKLTSTPPPATGPERCTGHVPYVRSFSPNVLEDKLGWFGGSKHNPSIDNAAVWHRGEWTISFVIMSADVGTWGSFPIIQDGDLGWGSIESSIGVGRQLYCGRELDNNHCVVNGSTTYDAESDRGSCSAHTLFGEDAYACHGGAACPFIVAEGHGPRVGEVWCRVVRISNDQAHHCKDDPSKFCHVVTLRVGEGNGTYLRVDDQPVDASRQMGLKAFFGGGTKPVIASDHLATIEAHNFEMDDECTDMMHSRLLDAYLTRRSFTSRRHRRPSLPLIHVPPPHAATATSLIFTHLAPGLT